MTIVEKGKAKLAQSKMSVQSKFTKRKTHGTIFEFFFAINNKRRLPAHLN